MITVGHRVTTFKGLPPRHATLYSLGCVIRYDALMRGCREPYNPRRRGHDTRCPWFAAIRHSDQTLRALGFAADEAFRLAVGAL